MNDSLLKTQPEIDRAVSGSILRIRMRSPFLATLALYTRFERDETVPLCTNSYQVFYHEGLLSLPLRQLDAALLHQVLHAALLHAVSRGVRDAILWNIAAEIIVNGALACFDFLELPKDAIRDKQLEGRPIEEVYEVLLRHSELPELPHLCLRPEHRCSEASTLPGVAQRKTALGVHWKMAIRSAEVAQRVNTQQNIPKALQQIFLHVLEPQPDWRDVLWRFLIKTPADYASFDRRLIERGLYLEESEIDPVQIYVGIDTAANIDREQSRCFLREVRTIVGGYPHLEAHLFYVGTSVSGPYEISGDEPAAPQGRESNFSLFFERLQSELQPNTMALCVCMTDRPEAPSVPETELSRIPVLWVVTPGGLSLEEVPFGQAVRFLQER